MIFRVMIINPSDCHGKFDLQPAKTSPITYHEIKLLILSSFPAGISQPNIEKLEFGYIKPGHGQRGKSGFWTMKSFLESVKAKSQAAYTWVL